MTNKFYLETGINYSNKGFRTKKIDLFGFIPDPTGPTHLKGIDSHHYIEIPLLFNYSVGNRKIKFTSSIGLGIDYLITSTHKKIIYYDISRGLF